MYILELLGAKFVKVGDIHIHQELEHVARNFVEGMRQGGRIEVEVKPAFYPSYSEMRFLIDKFYESDTNYRRR